MDDRIAPTVSLAQAASTRWDVMVIGAGPAGAFAARGLARAGFATLLVERKAFPRDKVCGGCLNAHALAVLAEAELLDVLRARGARPLSTIRLLHRGDRVDLRLPVGLAVSRATLDAVIVCAAIAAGSAFLPETSALVVPEVEPLEPGDRACRSVRLQQQPHQSAVANASVVVIGDGLAHSSLRDCPAFASVVSASARIGVGGLAHDVVAGTEPGVITMAIGRHGYVGAAEVEDGRTNIAAALDAGFLRQHRGPSECVCAILADAGVSPAEGFKSVVWHGTVPLTRRLARPAGYRLFVLGDAAGYIEPFTGEGMAWALTAARALVPRVARAVEAWTPALEQDWLDAHRLIVGREQRWCRVVARLLRHQWLVGPLVSSLRRSPGLARPILAHLTPGTRSIEDA
jgi:menaquinone-9 beta-reductase